MDFEKLYNTYYMQVYSYVMTLSGRPGTAEGITQSAFFKAMSSPSGYKGKSGELTWLCAIAKNLFFDEMRRQKRYLGSDEVTERTADTDIERQILNKDLAYRVHVALHKLEEPYKEVFTLRVFGELSFAQIGELFSKTENWARVTFHRARLKLKERIGFDNEQL